MKLEDTNKKVVVITLNYNQNQYTIDCIKSLLNSDYQNFTVCLIENGSTNENFKTLKEELPKDNRLYVERLENNIGYVGGVNHGIKQSINLDAEYIVIMNNDIIIDAKAITALVSTAQNHDNMAIVSGKVYNYDEKDTLQYIGNGKSKKELLDYPAYVKNRREKDVGQYDEEMEMGMLDDIFWVIPKKIIKKVGFYSDYFFLYGEQTDYALRAVRNGFKLIYTPNAKLWHKGSITTANGDTSSPKIEYWGSMAVMKLSILHFNGRDSNKIYLNWVIKRFVKNFVLVFKGKARLNIIKAHILAVIHFNFWKKIKYKDNGYNPFS
jgi:GT2 family glycosyltransferase